MPSRNASGPRYRSSIRRIAAPFWYVRTSNIPAVSSGECTGYSIARVLCSASTSLAAVQKRANADQRSQSGRIASVVRSAMKVANASFSQIPFHQRIVTRFAEPLVRELVRHDVGDVLEFLLRGVGRDPPGAATRDR